MKTYNWQQSDWPEFRYDLTDLQETLLLIAEKTGFVGGKLSYLNESQQMEAMIDLRVEEAIKTSAIEGEVISRPDVRSSIKNQLGINQKIEKIHDKRAQGVVEMLLDVRNTFSKALTKSRLFEWHIMLLSSSRDHHSHIGRWRSHKESMQIVSQQQGRLKVHYEAPPSDQVPEEMDNFIHWFNETAPGKSDAIKFAPVRAAIAHLYFESIHPFEDGNGRIGRAIAEKALSQGFGYPVMLSLSQAIEADKKSYYAALHSASKSNEITAWINYFVNVVLQAQMEVEQQIDFILKKSMFFDRFSDVLNERQIKVVRRMLQAGAKGFEGGMSAKKYMIIADTSKATATRDLQQLVEAQVLKQMGSGRSVRYELNLN